MLNPCVPVQSAATFLNPTYTLTSDISAMQVLPFDGSATRIGPVSKLPRGAKLETCGGGFNPTTMKVSYEGQYYFVFRQELGL